MEDRLAKRKVVEEPERHSQPHKKAKSSSSETLDSSLSASGSPSEIPSTSSIAPPQTSSVSSTSSLAQGNHRGSSSRNVSDPRLVQKHMHSSETVSRPRLSPARYTVAPGTSQDTNTPLHNNENHGPASQDAQFASNAFSEQFRFGEPSLLNRGSTDSVCNSPCLEADGSY